MISKSSGYAILALSCLHDQKKNIWIQTQEIVNRTDIPKPYLHKILHSLAGAGLVATKRGHTGGMALVKPKSKITILEIVQLVEGNHWSNKCLLGLEDCSEERACPAHEFWSNNREKIIKAVKDLTLSQVSQFEKEFGVRISPPT